MYACIYLCICIFGSHSRSDRPCDCTLCDKRLDSGAFLSVYVSISIHVCLADLISVVYAFFCDKRLDAGKVCVFGRMHVHVPTCM